jgi:hypothetical protein
MCGGSSSTQNEINQQQLQFYQNLNTQYNTVFGQNQAITGALTSAFTPILNAGPGQQGYTPQELQSLNTSSSENIATNYAQAQKATAQILAARGGGNDLLPSSVDANLLAQNTNLAAAQRASSQNQITQASYNQGNQNWLTAANVLGSTAGLLSPTSYASQVTGAGTAAATEANSINTANNSLWNAAIGSLSSVAGKGASALGGSLDPTAILNSAGLSNWT